MTTPWSFDAETAAGSADPTAGGALPIELPPEQQRYGVLWPVPAEMVSDHSAEGAPWQPTARNIPQDPPQGPLWAASHRGAAVPFDASGNQNRGASGVHQGTEGDLPAVGGAPDIGRPFTIRIAQLRHLVTDLWDSTGKRVSPADAPSAPHELYGSEHFTRPRMTPSQQGALFTNVADGEQFATNDPGYWGVSAAPSNMAPRPSGAVAAQMPSDPYVAAAVPGPAPIGSAASVDYGWDF